MRHCLTTRRTLVRGDGTTAHEGIFDLATGEFLRQTTQQGYRGDSCWSRGLAWSLYGFGTCYGSPVTRLPAVDGKCADFYIQQSPSDGVPPWDYDAPEESRKLLDTQRQRSRPPACSNWPSFADPERASSTTQTARHPDHAVHEYIGEGDANWEGILKGGGITCRRSWASTSR